MKRFTLILLIALSMTFAGVAMAQDAIGLKIIYGDIASVSDQYITVSTSDGAVQFKVDANTVHPEGMMVGQDIAIEYEVGDEADGMYLARIVRVDGEGSMQEKEMMVETDTTMEVDMDASMDATVEMEPVSTTTVTTTTTATYETEREEPQQAYTYSSNTLPQTAGWAPLAGLIGLVSLLGAALIRRS